MSVMNKSLGDIKAATASSAVGFGLVLLTIAGFIAGLWVLIAVVRVVMG